MPITACTYLLVIRMERTDSEGILHVKFMVVPLDLWLAAATVGLARVGRFAHDSRLDFHKETGSWIDKETGNAARDNDSGNDFPSSGSDGNVVINIVSEADQIKDNDRGEHADAVLESGKELEDVKAHDNGKETGNDTGTNGDSDSGHCDTVIVFGVGGKGGSVADSDSGDDEQDSVLDDTDNGKDNNGTTEIAAAAAALGSLFFTGDIGGLGDRDGDFFFFLRHGG